MRFSCGYENLGFQSIVATMNLSDLCRQNKILRQAGNKNQKKIVISPPNDDVMGYKESFAFFVPLLRNKYSLSLILFFVWIVFFDSDSLIERTINLKQVHRLENDRIFYENKIRDDRAKLEELESNPANLEKFAREHFLMKREGEDIFIIEE
jgi:hypothetical protein